MLRKKQNIFITGLPGCGKTTVIIKLASLLQNKILIGFYTKEIRAAGQRTGFSIRTVSGKEGILSSVNFHTGPRVGRYRVDVPGFEDIVLPELNRNPSNVDLCLIDEIGRMEYFSQKFVQSVHRILDSSVPVVATIAAKGKGSIAELKTRNDVTIIEITPKNRDTMPRKIIKLLE